MTKSPELDDQGRKSQTTNIVKGKGALPQVLQTVR